MSPLLSFVTTCKGRLGHFSATLPALAEQRDPCFTVSEGWRPFVANQEVERLMTIRMRPRQS